MEIILDSVLAFLSCVGLWTLGRLFLYYSFFSGGAYTDDSTPKEDLRWTIRKITMK